MGRSAGSDCGRSVFGGPPPVGGSRMWLLGFAHCDSEPAVVMTLAERAGRQLWTERGTLACRRRGVCAVRGGGGPDSCVVRGRSGRPGATDPGTVLSWASGSCVSALPPTVATSPGTDSVRGRRWCWCTARRGRRGRGDASLRVWPSASACMCSTCSASAPPTNAADRTSRSPGTGLAWPPCSSTGGSTARR